MSYLRPSFVLGCIFAVTVSAEDARPDELLLAIAHLSEERSYTWKSNTVSSGGMFVMPVAGQTELNGFTVVRATIQRGTSTAVARGGRAVYETTDGWLTAEQVRRLRLVVASPSVATPAEQLWQLVEGCVGPRVAGNKITATLTPDAISDRLQLPRSRPGHDTRPTLRDPAGSITVWLDHGRVTKFEVELSGEIQADPFPHRFNLATTVEISAVGSTRVDVPREAIAALDALANN
ncbi:MAG: hypothetical protein IAE82_13010 [Opitutaceae bacterium]|nr:hypothetical protein [Opitutaceae bacterium]